MISYSEYKLKGYKNIAKVMRYYKKHMKLFIGFFALTLLVAVANFLVPFLQGTIIEDISSAKNRTAITFSLILSSGNFLSLKGNAIFSYTFRWGKRAYFWNTVFTGRL